MIFPSQWLHYEMPGVLHLRDASTGHVSGTTEILHYTTCRAIH